MFFENLRVEIVFYKLNRISLLCAQMHRIKPPMQVLCSIFFLLGSLNRISISEMLQLKVDKCVFFKPTVSLKAKLCNSFSC